MELAVALEELSRLKEIPVASLVAPASECSRGDEVVAVQPTQSQFQQGLPVIATFFRAQPPDVSPSSARERQATVVKTLEFPLMVRPRRRRLIPDRVMCRWLEFCIVSEISAGSTGSYPSSSQSAVLSRGSRPC